MRDHDSEIPTQNYFAAKRAFQKGSFGEHLGRLFEPIAASAPDRRRDGTVNQLLAPKWGQFESREGPGTGMQLSLIHIFGLPFPDRPRFDSRAHPVAAVAARSRLSCPVADQPGLRLRVGQVRGPPMRFRFPPRRLGAWRRGAARRSICPRYETRGSHDCDSPGRRFTSAIGRSAIEQSIPFFRFTHSPLPGGSP